MRFLLLFVLLLGCSKQSPSEPSSAGKHVLVLAASDRATPQIGYTGAATLNYRFSNESFTFEVGPASGAAWLTGKGKMQLGHSNDMTITLESTSDRPYEIRLFGLAKTSDVQSNDAIEETIPVASGKQTLKVERFLIDTYDFTKR